MLGPSQDRDGTCTEETECVKLILSFVRYLPAHHIITRPPSGYIMVRGDTLEIYFQRTPPLYILQGIE